MRFDGYIRVSDTKGRGGESFLSPAIQRDTIERLAKAKSIELGEIVEEIDVSGGKRIEDRELGRLLERVETGESAGVIVWKLSRFSRSLLDAVEATTRITRAGGRLIADDFDSSQPMGKAMLGLLAGLAEEELDARREGWRQARARSVERGVPNGRAPLGYRKRPTDASRSSRRKPASSAKPSSSGRRGSLSRRSGGATAGPTRPPARCSRTSPTLAWLARANT